MSSFWMLGSSSYGTSTPMSPRAIMMPGALGEDLLDVVDPGLVLDLGDDGEVLAAVFAAEGVDVD